MNDIVNIVTDFVASHTTELFTGGTLFGSILAYWGIFKKSIPSIISKIQTGAKGSVSDSFTKVNKKLTAKLAEAKEEIEGLKSEMAEMREGMAVLVAKAKVDMQANIANPVVNDELTEAYKDIARKL